MGAFGSNNAAINQHPANQEGRGSLILFGTHVICRLYFCD